MFFRGPATGPRARRTSDRATPVDARPACRNGFTRLTGPANVLVMPGLQSASLSTKLLRAVGGESVLGPYILGLELPVQIAPMTASASDLVMLAVLAAGDAHARQQRQKAKR